MYLHAHSWVSVLLGALLLLVIACAGPTPAVTPARSATPTTAPMATSTKVPAAGSAGKQLFFEKGCIGCHKINGERGDVGPSLAGIWGKTVELASGEKVVVDHAYLDESIQNPDAKVVKGYQPGIMPKLGLTHEQAHELAEFIESLKGNGAPAGPAPTSPPATPRPGQAQVVMKDLTFQPKTIRIKAGTTVTWTNQDNFPHTVTSGTNRVSDGRFESGSLSAGKTFQSTFTEAGTFPYFCRFHREMSGTIVVEK